MLLAVAVIALAATPKMDWSPFFEKTQVSPAEVQLSRTRWRDGGRFALPFFNKSWDDWQALEPSVFSTGKNLLQASKKPSLALRQAASLLDLNVGEEKQAKTKGDLVDLIVACGGTEPAQIPELKNRVKRLPREVVRGVEEIIAVLPRANELRREAFAKISLSLPELRTEADNFTLYFGLGPHTIDMITNVDLARLTLAATILADAVESANLRHPNKANFDFTWNTTLGKIVLSGGGNQVHSLDGVCLAIDWAGNDTYTGGSSPSGVQVVVDSAGDDQYNSCSYALCGVSELFDYNGSDTYTTKTPGNAAAGFGVCLLDDEKGKDRYQCQDVGEGAAVCGIALLIDREGNDTYEAHSCSQGYGGVRGAGLLIDCRGKDDYNANDQVIDNPSAQTAEHNVSLSQGAGFGRRADGSDGQSMAGGIGLLIDGSGDDRYRCGVFGQGVGYWYGLGGLIDLGGNDSYEGVWYVQGSAAHYALGCLIDAQGNDRYEAKMHQSLGQGHDYSIGLLHDIGGENRFFGRGGGVFGTGRWNGLGLFRVDASKSTFETSAGDAFGFVGDFRQGESCNGLFWVSGAVDFGKSTRCSVNSVWTQQKSRIPGVIGVGLSTDGRKVSKAPN